MGNRTLRAIAATAAFWAYAHGGVGEGHAQVPAGDFRAQEAAVKAAEQNRQKADNERARALEAYRQARTDSARAMKNITDRIRVLEDEKKKVQSAPDSAQKTAAITKIDAEEKRLLAEGEKTRAAASAAQKNRVDATANFQKAEAAEKAAKEQLARVRAGQPAVPPASPVIPVAARPTAPAGGAPQPQALVNARMDVEAAEKAFAAATAARERAEAAVSEDTKELTRQLSLVAEQRKRIEAIDDKTKRDALLNQSAALEARIKGEMQQATAPVSAAQKAEAEARARYEQAAAAEKNLRAAAGQTTTAR